MHSGRGEKTKLLSEGARKPVARGWAKGIFRQHQKKWAITGRACIFTEKMVTYCKNFSAYFFVCTPKKNAEKLWFIY